MKKSISGQLLPLLQNQTISNNNTHVLSSLKNKLFFKKGKRANSRKKKNNKVGLKNESIEF
jgi:hypothetical protein